MRFRAKFPFWPAEAEREANGRMAKMQGNLHEISCGSDFADLKRPSYPVNILQLQALKNSQKISSNLLCRPWGFSMDSV